MAGGLTCCTFDGSGPVPFPSSFFLPLVFLTPFLQLCFSRSFFSPLFHFFYIFFRFLPFFNFSQGKASFPGAGGKKQGERKR